MKACGARTRGGGTCKKPAMPNGRCRLHGGATPSGPDSANFKHGRYATVFRGKLAEKFRQASGEEIPLDLLPELAVQRTLLSQHIEKISGKSNPTLADLKNISALAEDVVKTAATVAKMRNDTALTIAEVRFLQIGLTRLLEKYVTDPNKRRDFISDLRKLIPERIDADGGEPESVPAFAEATSEPA